ncbi:MAG TPA: hypothetical protein PKW80_04790 [Bacteroidales bacterium]|nr:hypothetical protein [Bacteroidales bacterium]
MITYLPYSKIDKNQWDTCIGNAPNGNIYAYSWYLDSCCECWDALVEDDYVSVMPLPFRKKIGFCYIFPPSLVQQLGVFSISEITENKIKEFIQSIPPKFRYATINLNHYNPSGTLNVKKETHINLELDLNRTYDELRQGYSENLRRNLKKIPENQFRVQKSDHIDDLIDLFISEKAKNIASMPGDYFMVLKKIFLSARTHSACELWKVYIHNELSAGILFVSGCSKTVFLFSASAVGARENHSMHFLIDRYIQEHAGKPLVLDFEGSDYESLARFYRSFGAVEKKYTNIEFTKLPDIAIKFLKSFFQIKNKLL